VKRRVLVVGLGGWATKVAKRLEELFSFEVRQLSARSLLINQVILEGDPKFHMLVSATRPEIQEQIILQCLDLSNHIWLEKPVSKTYEGAQRLFSLIDGKDSINSLVNFSWMFSEIWNKFKSYEMDFDSVREIEVSRNAYEETHSYMSAREDYGSHDIALLIDWITSMSGNAVDFRQQDFGANHFYTVLNNVPVKWKIEFNSQGKRMIWNITWKSSEKTVIDFYNNVILHRGERISVPISDNIREFVTVLTNKHKPTEKHNHQLALMTKEFFCS
jgi:hypothetical protein